MKTEYDKFSDSIYIYFSEFKNINKTISCNPLKIKQEVINFDIWDNNKIVWVEIIEWKYLWNFIKNKWKNILIYDSINDVVEIAFNKWEESYFCINNDKNYDEKNIFFWNIKISFTKEDKILNIFFSNASKILDLNNFYLLNEWKEL